MPNYENFSNVKSTVRTLRILELFENTNIPLSLTDTCKKLNIPKSSAYAIISTLVNEGYLEKISSKKFVLSFALYHAKGWIGGLKSAIRRNASDEMNRLLTLYGQSVILGMPKDDLNIEIVDYRQASHEMAYSVKYSSTVPSWCSSMGHAILSNLDENKVYKYFNTIDMIPLTSKTVVSSEKLIKKLKEWKRLGYALNIDERFDGASGVSVPIFDKDRNPKAALNIVMLSPGFKHKKDSMIKELKISAKIIEKKLFHFEEKTKIKRA